MALVIEKGGAVLSTARLWLTADRRTVVVDGDPDAAFLLSGCAGQEIPRVDAERLGLLESGAAVEPETMTNEEAQAAVESGEAEIPPEAVVETPAVEEAETDPGPEPEAVVEEAPKSKKKGRKAGR